MKPDILIVGGGINGCALALALANGGLRAAVIEPQSALALKDAAFDGRAYALAEATRKMLVALSVWPVIETEAQPIVDIVVSEAGGPRGVFPSSTRFDHREFDIGPIGYFVEDRVLRRALVQQAEANPLITLHFGAHVIAQKVDGKEVQVTLSDQTHLRARILVGCDGRRSGTAERAGIARHGRSYGQTALVTTIAHDIPHHGIAHQCFMRGGPLGIVPLPGNRSSIVWTETHSRARHLDSLDDGAFAHALGAVMGAFLGGFTLIGPRYTYDLELSVADRFVAQRLALVGDAAHGLHPVAGQSMNLGFRDVAALAETLITAFRRGEDIGAPSVLSRYQQWRRFDTNAMVLATDGVVRLFSTGDPILSAARNLGFGLLNALPGLRHFMMRQAAGLDGDLPKLMRGHQI